MHPSIPPSSTSPGSAVSLESLFPATLGGAPASVVVSTGKAAFASFDPPFVASMNDVLVQHGKTIDDLSVAFASFSAKGEPWSITAYRVPGLDAAVTATLNEPLLAALYPKARRAETTIAGKDVTLLSDGKYSPKGRFTYIYLKDDVAWYVDAVDPDLTHDLHRPAVADRQECAGHLARGHAGGVTCVPTHVSHMPRLKTLVGGEGLEPPTSSV